MFCRPKTEDTREEECVTFVVLHHSLCERVSLRIPESSQSFVSKILVQCCQRPCLKLNTKAFN